MSRRVLNCRGLSRGGLQWLSRGGLMGAALAVAVLLLLPGAPALAATSPAATSPTPTGSLPAGVLGVDTEHLVLRVDDRGMVVTDAVRVINGSSKAAERLTFPIPEGYTELSFLSGSSGSALTDAQVIKEKDGFIARDPLPAGQTLDVAFSYRLPISSHTGTLNRRIAYPTGNFSLVVQVDQLTLKGDGLVAGDTVSLNGAVFQEYHRESIQAGTVLAVNWSLSASGGSAASPTGSASTGGTSGARAANGLLGRLATGGALPIAIFLVGVVVVASGGYAYLRSRRGEGAALSTAAAGAGAVRSDAASPGAAGGPMDGLLQRKAQLIREIAALDRRHGAGEVTDDDYQVRRSAAKAELIQVMLALRQAGKD